MLGAVFSLLLAAASPGAQCTAMYAPLATAETHVKAAETAAAAKLNATATSEHDAAMAILGPLPWLPSDNACDPKKFALTKMSLMSRSLVVAVKDGSMSATDARAKNSEMWDGMLPGAAQFEVSSAYPDLFGALTAPKDELDTLWLDEQIAWHKPAGANCAHPDLDPMIYGSTASPDPNEAMNMIQVGMQTTVRRGRTDVLVKLDQTGAITDSYIVQSSGDRAYDNIILSQARHGKYLPKIAGCKAVPSTYTYSSALVKG
ncbi:MAG TPA: TonB C-terminal domain-containing protein [Candidatus Baltobacteraceae bacterium]|nr:TonB C-terminal domain-containing protein [Candidatus Baltobacteraceae bacterium]